jgi:hypothetical protein
MKGYAKIIEVTQEAGRAGYYTYAEARFYAYSQAEADAQFKAWLIECDGKVVPV